MPLLTGDFFLDEQILLDLDIVDLLNTLSTNSEIYHEFSNDTFWRRRIMKEVSSKIANSKPPNEKYFDQYIYLYRSTLDRSIDDNRLDGILYNSKYIQR